MEVTFSDKYSFLGEWYDSQANLIRRFNIFFYPYDDTLEMFEIKNRKTFVRRVKVDGISLDSFYIDCTLCILGRMIKIIDFGCQDTKLKLQKQAERTFVLFKLVPNNIVGKILTHFHENGLRLSRMKKTKVTTDDLIFLFRRLVSDPSYPLVLDQLGNQFIYGLELVGKDAVAVCNKVIGNQDPTKAKPGTIRALYGFDTVRNCVYTETTTEDAVEDIDYFFPPPLMSQTRLRLTATLSNCTLCIVKPHAVREGKLGAAFEAIDEGGFNITALTMFIVEHLYAAEFYEVYKGIVPEYKGMVEELASGPCVAMEIVAKDKNIDTAVEFRKLVGPSDPEIARLLRPNTLRAKLGTTKVKNAIHCSDLAEDGLLEVEYFFKILSI